MLSNGIRNPQRSLFIAAAITLAAWISLALGIWEYQATGVESVRSGLMIALAILPAAIGPLLVWNFWSAIHIMYALRRGEGVLARWRFPAEQYSGFVAEDDKRSSLGIEFANEWTPPQVPPPDGIDVIFGRDRVLVHDTYFPLGLYGPFRFVKVGIVPHSPLSLEFVTISTAVTGGTTTNIRRTPGVLRLPLDRADSAEAALVVQHYRDVLAGRATFDPEFYLRRMRIGLIGAAIFLPIVGIGYVLEHFGGYGDAPLVAMIFGGIFGGAALVLAGLAWWLQASRGRR
jgi:hypothetical protein